MSHQKQVAHLPMIKWGSQSTFHHQLEEELHLMFIGTRADGVGSLDYYALLLNSQGEILTWLKGDEVLGANPDGPQIFSMIFSKCDRRFLEFLGGDCHAA
jgi:hypothetical protein